MGLDEERQENRKPMLRIGMILDNEFNRDIRVENEIESLQEAGYQVFLLGVNFGDLPEISNFNGATINRFSINKKYFYRIKGLNNTLINIYPRLWSRKIREFIARYKIDVLHVHDLWMLEATIRANKEFKLPMISDLHENFVSAMYNYKYVRTFPGNILISISRWRRMEKIWMDQADFFITAIEEAKERLIGMSYDGSKIAVVPNYVNISEFISTNKELEQELLEKYRGFKTIIYTGAFDLHRGLEIAIRAMAQVIKVNQNVKLILVGTGKNIEELKKLSRELKVNDYVIFEGWQNPEDLPTFVKMSDCGIIPHLKTDHTDNTIPHKLFQYMVMKKPVIGSNCTPIKRIVEDADSGIIYTHDSSQELAKVILKIVDPKLICQKGENGYLAVKNKYNWTNSAKALLDLYRKIK